MALEKITVPGKTFPYITGGVDKNLEININVRKDGFWGKNVESCTALVGMNGSGKSTICRQLYQRIFPNNIAYVKPDFSNEGENILFLGSNNYLSFESLLKLNLKVVEDDFIIGGYKLCEYVNKEAIYVHFDANRNAEDIFDTTVFSKDLRLMVVKAILMESLIVNSIDIYNYYKERYNIFNSIILNDVMSIDKNIEALQQLMCEYTSNEYENFNSIFSSATVVWDKDWSFYIKVDDLFALLEIIPDNSTGIFRIINPFKTSLYVKNNDDSYTKIFSNGEIEILKISTKLNEIKSDIDKKRFKSLGVALDEPDHHLHPEWQRKFMKHLLDFLNQDVFKDYKFQIIIATHSPLLLSDFPAEDIVYLGDQGRELNNNKPKTFGANIHDLYKHSFFLDNTMGEFALDKVKDVVAFLEGKKKRIVKGVNNEEIEVEVKITTAEQALQIIEMIGEPILRNKLADMYDEYHVKNYMKYVGKSNYNIFTRQQKLIKTQKAVIESLNQQLNDKNSELKD